MGRLIFVLLFLLSTDFWSNRLWLDMQVSSIIKQVIGFILLIFSIIYLKKNKDIFFRKELIIFLLTFLFSAVSSYILYRQSFYLSIKGSMTFVYPVGLFLFAHKCQLSEKFILKSLLFFTFIFTAIEIFEQFTYPAYWFCGRIEKEGQRFVEERMGLWRMYIFGIYYCLLVFVIVLQKIINGDNLKTNTINIVVIFIGIVCFVARKDIFAALSVVPLAFIFGKGKNRVYAKLILIVLVIGAIFYLPTLMEDLIDQTTNEIGDEDFIRYVAAFHFLFEMNDSPLYYLFGAGIPTGDSQLYSIVEDLAELRGIYQADCGFVGYFSKVGIVGFLPYVLIFKKIIANHTAVELFSFLYIVVIIELSFFDFWGDTLRNLSAFMIFLYLTEICIRRNKKKKPVYS